MQFLKKLLILSILQLFSNSVKCQSEENEKLYIEIMEVLFEQNIFNSKILEIELGNESICFIGNECKCIDPDTTLLFTNDSDTIKIWPYKMIFFYDIPKWIRIFDCNLNEISALINFEIISNEYLLTSGSVNLEFINEKWVIKSKQIINFKKPKLFIPSDLRKN